MSNSEGNKYLVTLSPRNNLNIQYSNENSL